MELYSHLARVYDEVFPIAPAAIAFIDRVAGANGKKGCAVDLGSATGAHAFALAERGWEVTGIEFSAELFAISRNKQAKNGSTARFLQADMRDLGRHFGVESTDLVLCLGNTLPHLSGLPEIRNFLVAARQILRHGGRIILQLVNFDRAGAGFVFPVITGTNFRFERSYEGLPEGGIAFDTRLSFDDGPAFADRTALFPLTPARLESALTDADFSIESRCAGWDGGDFDPASSAYLIIVGVAA